MKDFIKKYTKDRSEYKKYKPLFDKYREFTMIPQQEFIDCLTLAERVKDVKGCIIECGVWRGGMMAGFAGVAGINRTYYLFDSFEGLPPAKEIDGASAIAWQKDVNSPAYHDNCKAEMDWSERAMKKSGAQHYNLMKGWFDQTLPTFQPKEPIALLHLDADWYDSTLTCLKYLFPKMAKNGLIILDDYYLWDGMAKAIHDYLSRNSLPLRIMQFNNGHIHYIVNT